MSVKSFKWTESEVFRRLYHVWPSPAHTCLPQVRNGTGHSRKTTRTADALVVSTWPSRGMWLAGIEIKVSRSDWKQELANPAKAADIARFCKYWYVAAPVGVVPVEQVPETWGLVEVQQNTAKIVKSAPASEYLLPDMPLVCSILRAVESVTIPADHVRRQIDEAVSKHKVDAEKVAADYTELLDLRHCIQTFEEKSGLVLSGKNSMAWWRMGNIAEAVRIIVDAGSPENALKRLRDEYETVTRVADKIGKALAATES